MVEQLHMLTTVYTPLTVTVWVRDAIHTLRRTYTLDLSTGEFHCAGEHGWRALSKEAHQYFRSVSEAEHLRNMAAEARRLAACSADRADRADYERLAARLLALADDGI